MTQLPDHFNDVPSGWRGLLENLHQKLLLIDSEYSTSDVKEKFGALRVSLFSPENNDARNAIADVEWRSEKVCELCGAPGRQVCSRGWWRALCRSHEHAEGGGND